MASVEAPGCRHGTVRGEPATSQGRARGGTAGCAMLGRCESEDYEGPSDRCPCEAEHICLACDRAKCDGCMSGGMHPLCLECTDRFVEAGFAVVDAPDASLPEIGTTVRVHGRKGTVRQRVEVDGKARVLVQFTPDGESAYEQYWDVGKLRW